MNTLVFFEDAVSSLERWTDCLLPEPILSAAIAVAAGLVANGLRLAEQASPDQERHVRMSTLFQTLSAVAAAVMLLGEQMAEIKSLFRWLPTTASFLPLLWLLLFWLSSLRTRVHPGVLSGALALSLAFGISAVRSALASTLSPCELGIVYPEICYSVSNWFGSVALFVLAVLLWLIAARCVLALVATLAARR